MSTSNCRLGGVLTALTLSTITSLPASALAQTGECLSAPPYPAPVGNVVTVSSVEQLNDAITNLSAKTTIVIEPGRYRLTRTLGVEKDNVTIRGATNDCSMVELTGPGMDEANHGGVHHGFWINANNTTIANLSLGEVYFHTIQVNDQASAPHIYNVRMFNSGQQFIKANPTEFGDGVDNGIVEFSIMEYTDGPPKTNHEGAGLGYTNGVDVHAGANWRVSNNLFRNFHTPDNADHLFNAAVLFWNGARNTVTENNVFINVDRAIAYGLEERTNEHQGGIVRNNMISMSPNLYSDYRREASDAVISIMNSPKTKVLHNTVLTAGNTNQAIELRSDSSSVEVSNNITDAPISHRDRKYFIERNNLTDARAEWFQEPGTGNLRLRPEISEGRDKVRAHRSAPLDIDRQQRPMGRKVDLGADEG